MNKRLTAMVSILNGMVVQSFSYNKYLPIGTPEIVCENLSRWNADEIIISLIDLSKKKCSPNLKLLEKISSSNISTPVIYAGGIRNVQDAINVINSGADRIVIDSIIQEKNIDLINEISNKIGSQALILSIPIIIKYGHLYRYDYISNHAIPFDNIIKTLDALNFSEVLIIDKLNDGGDEFNLKILSLAHNYFNCNLMVFGGISNYKTINELTKFDKVSSIVIGNSLNYKEIQISNIKNKFKKKFRKVNYE
jgi:cyclase